jgi:hypothetical protein
VEVTPGGPDDIRRDLMANQPAPGVIVARTLASYGVTDLALAQALLEDLQRHYELRPR